MSRNQVRQPARRWGEPTVLESEMSLQHGRLRAFDIARHGGARRRAAMPRSGLSPSPPLDSYALFMLACALAPGSGEGFRETGSGRSSGLVDATRHLAYSTDRSEGKTGHGCLRPPSRFCTLSMSSKVGGSRGPGSRGPARGGAPREGFGVPTTPRSDGFSGEKGWTWTWKGNG